MMDTLSHWLLTYLLHSTLLLGCVALLRFLLADRRLALQEALLRAALLGGFLTATLQVGFDVRPMGGSLNVPYAAPVLRLPVSPRAMLGAPPPTSPATSSAWAAPAAAPASRSLWGLQLALPSGLRGVWRPGLLGAWTALALVSLARLAVAGLRLRRMLHGRRALSAPGILDRLRSVATRLRLAGPLRLSAAPRLAVPLATGWLRPEVCLPERVLVELSDEEQLAICAHELAHVARRDPGWRLLTRLAAALAPLQPLNRWATRRLSDLAECLSDDLAVSAAVRPHGLAASLVDVASWSLAEPAIVPATAAGAFGSPSRLAYRVERLMNPVRTLEMPRRLFLPLAAGAVLATALVSPVVSGSAHEPASTEDAQAIAAAPPAPPAPPVPPARPAPPVVSASVDEADSGDKAREAAAPPPPAPPLPSAGPMPPKAPAPPHEPADAEERLRQLTERIGQRVDRREQDLARLEAEIEASARSLAPNEAQMARLNEELARSLAEMAAALNEQQAGRGVKEHSAERIAELRGRIQAATSRVHLTREHMHALVSKARALAEMARPTSEELQELTQLSKELADEVAPEAQRAAGVAQAHEAMRKAHEQLRQAHEQVRQAQEQERHALERARAAQDQARRALEQERRALQNRQQLERRPKSDPKPAPAPEPAKP